MFRSRTIHRAPEEKRWLDNRSFATALPWKLNIDHGAGAEVFLDATPPEPSMQPATTPLPPTATSEPVTRRFYVKTADVGPQNGGMGPSGDARDVRR